MGKITVKFEELVSIRNGKCLFITKKKYLDKDDPFPLLPLIDEKGKLHKHLTNKMFRSILDDNFGYHWFHKAENDEFLPFSDEEKKILLDYLSLNDFKNGWMITNDSIIIDE